MNSVVGNLRGSMGGLVRGIRTRRAVAKELEAAQDIDLDAVRSVCLFLGPYRNLTTLTASTLFLHPHCQVLNHAGRRILGNRRLDFLADYESATFDNFVRYAIAASAGGERGSAGGSITHSHAFSDNAELTELFEESGGDLVKSEIHSLVWKESLATANHLRENKVDLGALLAREPRLRFLQPVRHPIDAAISSRNKGFSRHFEGLDDDAALERVLDAIVDEYAWLDDVSKSNPERFFVFFEHSLDRDLLERLAAFLELEPLDSWLDAASQAFEVKARYDHSDHLVSHYREAVSKRLDPESDLGANLLRFTPAS